MVAISSFGVYIQCRERLQGGFISKCLQGAGGSAQPGGIGSPPAKGYQRNPSPKTNNVHLPAPLDLVPGSLGALWEVFLKGLEGQLLIQREVSPGPQSPRPLASP